MLGIRRFASAGLSITQAAKPLLNASKAVPASGSDG
jgi:hypothetical protein